jgi:hypothetical protein
MQGCADLQIGHDPLSLPARMPAQVLPTLLQIRVLPAGRAICSFFSPGPRKFLCPGAWEVGPPKAISHKGIPAASGVCQGVKPRTGCAGQASDF